MMLIRSVASLLGLALLTSAQKCSVTQERDPGQVETVPCVFPFTWQGKTFNSCTKEGDDQGKLWCSTMVDQAGNHVTGQGQYGFCSQGCNQGLRRV